MGRAGGSDMRWRLTRRNAAVTRWIVHTVPALSSVAWAPRPSLLHQKSWARRPSHGSSIGAIQGYRNRKGILPPLRFHFARPRLHSPTVSIATLSKIEKTFGRRTIFDQLDLN